jgi:hypothetical protein
MAVQKQKTDYMPFVWIGGGLLLYNKFFGKTKEEQEGEHGKGVIEHTELKNNPFAVGSYKAPPKKEGFTRWTLNSVETTNAIKQIDDGLGWLTDDISSIMNAIKIAKTRSDLYLIAGMYSKKYKRDLWTDLSKLSDSNLAKVTAFVNKLPQYVKGKTN